MTDVLVRLSSEPEKNQLKLIQTLASEGDSGLDVLLHFLLERHGKPVTPADGKAYQVLIQSDRDRWVERLHQAFPHGLVPLASERGVDYSLLQTQLVQQQYEEADRLTLAKLCELAGDSAMQRKWIYFTEVEQLPIADLQTLNTLWQVYSEGRFGFSVQRELWLGVGTDWDKLWPMIGWKSGNTWTRYPQGFTWDVSAPRGHLPLSNQLRGVRVMDALLRHPAWTTGAIAP